MCVHAGGAGRGLEEGSLGGGVGVSSGEREEKQREKEMKETQRHKARDSEKKYMYICTYIYFLYIMKGSEEGGEKGESEELDKVERDKDRRKGREFVSRKKSVCLCLCAGSGRAGFWAPHLANSWPLAMGRHKGLDRMRSLF